MAIGSIGMGEQDQAARAKFENELKRVVDASDKAGVLLRVIGSLAFQIHSPEFGFLQAAMGRAYTDIDFAAYRRQGDTPRAEEMLAVLDKLNKEEIERIRNAPGDRKAGNMANPIIKKK